MLRSVERKTLRDDTNLLLRLRIDDNKPSGASAHSKAMALAVTTICLPAQGHSTDENTLTRVKATAQYGAVALNSDGLVTYTTNSQQRRGDEISYFIK